jgi:hypothetical protein
MASEDYSKLNSVVCASLVSSNYSDWEHIAHALGARGDPLVSTQGLVGLVQQVKFMLPLPLDNEVLLPWNFLARLLQIVPSIARTFNHNDVLESIENSNNSWPCQ